MESNYALRAKAEEDVEQILGYISEDSPKAALKVYQTFLEQFKYLAKFPKMGRLRKEFSPEIRSLIVGNYVVFFEGENPVEIVRVLHGARDFSEGIEDM